MIAGYGETGGLRWGSGFGSGWNASWPFAGLLVSPERLTITLNGIGLVRRSFVFAAADLLCLSFRPGRFPFATGLVIGHRNPAQPPLILFWIFRPGALRQALIAMGYSLNDPVDGVLLERCAC